MESEEEENRNDSPQSDGPAIEDTTLQYTDVEPPMLVFRSNPDAIDVYKDHLETVAELSATPWQLLLSLAIHMRCSSNVEALSRLTGLELEGICTIVHSGLELSKALPQSTAYGGDDITGLMEPLLEQLANLAQDGATGSQPVPKFTNPMSILPDNEDGHREKVWVKQLKKRDGACVITRDDLVVEAAYFIPNIVVFDGHGSPFWALVFLFFGADVMKLLKSQVVEGSRELLRNRMALDCKFHKAWDQDRIRFDFVFTHC